MYVRLAKYVPDTVGLDGVSDQHVNVEPYRPQILQLAGMGPILAAEVGPVPITSWVSRRVAPAWMRALKGR